MVIMLVGLLGLLQSVNIAMEYNLKNQMRNEVVRVAQDAMNDMRSRAFNSVSSKTTTVPSSLRNINRTYSVKRTVLFTGTSSSRKYQVDVRWKYKNVSTTHSVMSVRSRVE
jgi:type IV pilus assembly protein PilV